MSQGIPQPPPPPPTYGKSGGGSAALWIVLLLGGGVLGLVCCGGAGLVGLALFGVQEAREQAARARAQAELNRLEAELGRTDTIGAAPDDFFDSDRDPQAENAASPDGGAPGFGLLPFEDPNSVAPGVGDPTDVAPAGTPAETIVGEWVDSTLNVTHTISLVRGVPTMTGAVDDDAEVLEVLESNWDGSALSARIRVPSTGYTLLEELTTIGENQIEGTLASIDTSGSEGPASPISFFRKSPSGTGSICR